VTKSLPGHRASQCEAMHPVDLRILSPVAGDGIQDGGERV
jgi:hypothetical protein